MIKRTLFFSNPYHLNSRNRQLVIDNKETGQKTTAPIEDIGFIVFEHPQITFTQSVMQLLAENNTAVIFCNNRYMPSSMLLHLHTNQVQAELFKHQINAGAALKNQLWKQTIEAKISNQAALLKIEKAQYRDLLQMVKKVKSGDKENIEGWAARIYWPRLLGKKFRRMREGAAPNSLLNYGYAILRAATARALSGSGLLPTLGIFHRNRYNAFALADDIMEPYRPYVDRTVLDIFNENPDYEELTTDLKKSLLEILTIDVEFENIKRPLMVGLSQTTASLAKCFSAEKRKLEYPLIQ